MTRRNKNSQRSGDEPRASRLPPVAPPRNEEPVRLSLRDIEPPPPPPETDAPVDDGLIVSDSQPRPVPWLGDPDAERAEQRAQRRAQVRRDRLQHAAELSDAEARAAEARAAQQRAAELQAAQARAAQARADEQRAADVRAAQERAALAHAEEARRAAAEAQAARAQQVREAEGRAAERAALARAAEQRAAQARELAEREAEAKAAALRDAEARAAAEAAARAAAAAPPPPETLVLGDVSAAIRAVCQQLAGFGFRVRTMNEPPQLPAPWPYVAVFVDRALAGPDGSDSIDLCNHVREASRLPGERKPVLLLVADQLSSTDRVRAGLAGCNELIVGEITRGAVAGALDRRGIVLPSDARRL